MGTVVVVQASCCVSAMNAKTNEPCVCYVAYPQFTRDAKSMCDYGLRVTSQANPYAVHYPPDPRNDCSYRSVRSLLQELSTLHTHSDLRYDSGDLTGENPPAGPLRLHTTSVNIDPARLTLGDLTLVLVRPRWSSFTSAKSHGRGHCSVLLAHTSLEILSVASTITVSLFSATQWAHRYGI